MQQLCGGFGCLRLLLDINDNVGHRNLLEVCIQSMNLQVRQVGILEIQSVYFQVWQEDEDTDIWNDLENVVFKEVCRRDRVARFHRVVVDE